MSSTKLTDDNEKLGRFELKVQPQERQALRFTQTQHERILSSRDLHQNREQERKSL